MAIFMKGETRSKIFTEEEQEVLVSLLPGFRGLDERNYKGMDAIKNSDVFTAVNMIASDVASLRLEMLKDDVKDTSDPFLSVFNTRPNQYYTGYQLRFILMANALLNGQSFAEIVRDRAGAPVEVFHIPNSKISYKQDASTGFKLVYDYQETASKVRKIPSEDMLHIKFFSLDGIEGKSPLLSLQEDLNTQANSKKFLSNFFKNGTQNGGLLTYKGGKLSKEARNKLRDEWQESNSGADKAHKVLVLDETMEYKAIQIDTEILKLINTSVHSTVQIAKAYGIPRFKFGLETSNMSLEQMNLDYLINTLSPYLESFVSELNFKLIPIDKLSSNRYWFNTDNKKIIDAETKNKIIKDQRDTGIISTDEARAKHGFPPLPNGLGAKNLVSLNYTTLDMLEEYQMKKAGSLPVPKGGEIDGT